MTVLELIDEQAKTEPIAAAVKLCKALMAGDTETLKQGYSFGNALIAVAERYHLDIGKLAIVAERIAGPYPLK